MKKAWTKTMTFETTDDHCSIIAMKESLQNVVGLYEYKSAAEYLRDFPLSL